MNSRQRRKLEAEEHNKMREQAKADQAALEKDKAENPEKYQRRKRQRLTKLGAFMAVSAAMSASNATNSPNVGMLCLNM